ncbi:hypothetical protein E6C27_scaffold679G00140 [Cucumis melo var. makuwa]|uniref:Uncharacterized protein n=1 Tax=Cucumis melo var. makuwa TaxID=1194695 RepID=A0A5A7V4V1_CUCMM|nr:hypothetical protein E6C27_scaffold679G00140 [Cucumis melo var. makuwa]
MELQQTKAVYQAPETGSLPGKWQGISSMVHPVQQRCVGYTQYNNVYKFYDVVRLAQHSHRLCRSGARPALTTASLLRSTLNVNNEI